MRPLYGSGLALPQPLRSPSALEYRAQPGLGGCLARSVHGEVEVVQREESPQSAEFLHPQCQLECSPGLARMAILGIILLHTFIGVDADSLYTGHASTF